MIPSDAIGYLASGLVLATFCMRKMTPLRVAAICSNIAFIAYAVPRDLHPVLALHVILLPLNTWRLRELRRSAATSDAAAPPPSPPPRGAWPALRVAGAGTFRHSPLRRIAWCTALGVGLSVVPAARLAAASTFEPNDNWFQLVWLSP